MTHPNLEYQLIGKVFPLIKEGMGLIDYPSIVKYPMDLGTINKKLREDRYNTVEEVLDDIQLIWDNCKLYNEQGCVLIIKCSGSMIWRKNYKDLSRKWSKPIFPPSNCLNRTQLKLPLHLPRQNRNNKSHIKIKSNLHKG